jgi:hypothetical protein
LDSVCRILYGPIADRTLRLLAQYETATSALLARGLDTASYSEALKLFNDLQTQAAQLPQAQVAWIELMISRFEFTQALWTNDGRAAESDKLRTLGAAHLAAVARFSKACRAFYGAETSRLQ